jgi:hypothetical protein
MLIFEDVPANNSFPSSRIPFSDLIMNQKIASPSISGAGRAILPARDNYPLLS